MIAIIDYRAGNVRSVSSAFDYLGLPAVLTADPIEIAAADRIVLPGVGAFGDAMKTLREQGLVDVLSAEVLGERKPFLGICLGMQLLARSSTEHGTHEGLGWLDADVVRFHLGHLQPSLKVPHMGWNTITPQFDHPMFKGLRDTQFEFYFVHSFHVVCHDPNSSAALCEHGDPFTAAVSHANIFGTQFHPEKSQDSGLQLLKNFSTWTP